MFPEIGKQKQKIFGFKVINKSLNSDGQQFHQYQQNRQSPQIFTHLTWGEKNDI